MSVPRQPGGPVPVSQTYSFAVSRCCIDCQERDLQRAGTLGFLTMILCPECGNKRCPKASNHNLVCTGSNEPGQPGSYYGAVATKGREN